MIYALGILGIKTAEQLMNSRLLPKPSFPFTILYFIGGGSLLPTLINAFAPGAGCEAQFLLNKFLEVFGIPPPP